MHKKGLLLELKKIWLSDKNTRKDILRVFSWAILGTETTEEMKRNQQQVFQILMSEESEIRNFLMENIWLSEDTLTLLNHHLSWKEFYDLKVLFESLKDFFSSHYKNIDFVVYRLNKTKNALEFFAGKDSLATNISLWEVTNSDFKNEVSAMNDEKKKFFSLLDKWTDEEYYFGSVWAIKVETSIDTYIFSFHRKEINEVNENDLKSDILKIKKLFTKYGLTSILDNIIKYINARYKDELTGLFNRNFISALPKHMRHSVLFIDLDKFKSINDTYWHQNGDVVLQWVANLLKDSVRPRDKVCRISWDEFAVLVPTNSSTELDAIQKRIERWLQEKKFAFRNNNSGNEDEIKITATIWKALSDSKKTLDEIISEADLEMLGGKSSEGTNYRIFSVLNALPKSDQLEVLWMWICDTRCNLECPWKQDKS